MALVRKEAAFFENNLWHLGRLAETLEARARSLRFEAEELEEHAAEVRRAVECLRKYGQPKRGGS